MSNQYSGLDNEASAQSSEVPSVLPNDYQSPAIESVLTPEALEREVHYAGGNPVSNPDLD